MSRRLIPLALLILLPFAGASCSDEVSEAAVDVSTQPANDLWGDYPHERPACIRGIHLTSWFTGSKKARKIFEPIFSETEVNTAVIDIKEVEGDVYIPGVDLDGQRVYRAAMPDLESYLTYLKDRGVYTIARIVLFKDMALPKLKPEWAVKSSSALPKAVQLGYEPDVWVDNIGKTWADPYNKNVWDYNLRIAERAVEMGFQGVQFDYIRFPSDGPTQFCRYSQPHSSESAVANLASFLEYAHKRLSPKGVEVSIDVFGLAGSYDNDLGIGQKLSRLLEHVDVVSPMKYPSHYGSGEYGIGNPNAEPYPTVFKSTRDTVEVLHGSGVGLRPYLQDFSLGIKYTADYVRDQIEAVYDNGVGEWLLWNPACRYTMEALKPKGSPGSY